MLSNDTINEMEEVVTSHFNNKKKNRDLKYDDSNVKFVPAITAYVRHTTLSPFAYCQFAIFIFGNLIIFLSFWLNEHLLRVFSKCSRF